MFFFLRAYAAYEENAAIDHELEHRERLNLQEYQDKYTSYLANDPLSILSAKVKEYLIGHKPISWTYRDTSLTY